MFKKKKQVFETEEEKQYQTAPEYVVVPLPTSIFNVRRRKGS